MEVCRSGVGVCMCYMASVFFTQLLNRVNTNIQKCLADLCLESWIMLMLRDMIITVIIETYLCARHQWLCGIMRRSWHGSAFILKCLTKWRMCVRWIRDLWTNLVNESLHCHKPGKCACCMLLEMYFFIFFIFLVRFSSSCFTTTYITIYNNGEVHECVCVWDWWWSWLWW